MNGTLIDTTTLGQNRRRSDENERLTLHSTYGWNLMSFPGQSNFVFLFERRVVTAANISSIVRSFSDSYTLGTLCLCLTLSDICSVVIADCYVSDS